MYASRSKSSKPNLERRALAEYFCCGDTLPLLIKLEKPIQISVLIFVQIGPKDEKWVTNLKMDKTQVWAVINNNEKKTNKKNQKKTGMTP